MCAGVPSGEHARYEGPDAVQDAPQVHAKGPFEVGGGPIPDQAPREHARVVAQDVDRAEGRVGVVGQCFDGVGARNVGDERRRLDQRCRGLGQGAGLDVGGDDTRALGRERLRQCSADPASGTRDHCDLAVEVLHGRAWWQTARSHCEDAPRWHASMT